MSSSFACVTHHCSRLRRAWSAQMVQQGGGRSGRFFGFARWALERDHPNDVIRRTKKFKTRGPGWRSPGGAIWGAPNSL